MDILREVEAIILPGFEKLNVFERSACNVHNPSAGELMTIEVSKVAKFSVGKISGRNG